MIQTAFILFLVSGLTIPMTLGEEIIIVKKPEFRSVRFIDDMQGWIAGSRGVFLTVDGGKIWKRQPIKLWSGSQFTTTAAARDIGWISFVDRSNLIIRSDDGLVFGGPYDSHWRKVKIPIGILQYMSTISFADMRYGLGGGDLQIYITGDGGETWNAKDIDVKPTGRFTSLFMLSPLEGFAVGTNATLLKTTNGGISWERRYLRFGTNGLSGGPDFWSIRFIDKDNGWITGTDGIILNTEDGGNTWRKQESPFQYSTALCAVSFANRTEGWVVGQRYLKGGNYESVILHTLDGGKNWVTQAIKLQDHLLDVQALSNGVCWVVGKDGTVLMTKDHGETWELKRIE
jgi:photosystem II stability/assembly factor-like uncharacterized protein